MCARGECIISRGANKISIKLLVLKWQKIKMKEIVETSTKEEKSEYIDVQV